MHETISKFSDLHFRAHEYAVSCDHFMRCKIVSTK